MTTAADRHAVDELVRIGPLLEEVLEGTATTVVKRADINNG